MKSGYSSFKTLLSKLFITNNIKILSILTLMLLLNNSFVFAADNPMGFLVKVEWLNKCSGQIKITAIVGETSNLNTGANSDFFVGGNKIASSAYNSTSGAWDFKADGTDYSITSHSPGVTGAGGSETSSNQVQIYITYLLQPDDFSAGTIEVEIKPDCANSNGSGDCGAVAGDQILKLKYPDISAVSNLSSKMDDYAMVTLDWSNPSGDFSKVKIFRDGDVVATLSGGESTWTDDTENLSAEKYQIQSLFTEDGCDYAGASASVVPPKPPYVIKPDGLITDKNSCNGNVVITWNYAGDVVPNSFTIKRTEGGNSVDIEDIENDKREYIDSLGIHTTATYSVCAVGKVNTSDFTTSTSTTTYGFPSAPNNFSASKNTSSITLSWKKANYCNSYLLKRSSASGSTEIEVDSEDANITYVDATVSSCEQYTYQLYATNGCTSDAGITGVKATAGDVVEKLTPQLNSYITDIDASKAYYSNKVLVEWTVQSNNLNLVDLFEISRSVADVNDYKLIGTIIGNSSYEDLSAVGGVMYNYKVKGKLDCEGDIEFSNTATTAGFRTPYGIVNGHIEYESGIAVKGVEVLAEKASDIIIGNSLLFNGGYVQIPNHSKFNPNKYIVAEAWIKPNSLGANKFIVNKGNYYIKCNNNDVEFGVNVNGMPQIVTAPQVLNANTYVHVAGVKDSTGVKIYINGKIPTNVTYKITDDVITGFNDINLAPDVITSLSSLQGVIYNTYLDLETAIENKIGVAQTKRNMPLILPYVKNEVHKPGTVINVVGNIYSSTNPVKVGSNFYGNIDELRIWNNSKNEEEIFFDYKRIVGNDALGLSGYWRMDENFGSTIYDASKSSGEFHKNDGNFIGSVDFDSAIPNSSMLGWVGVTNAEGDYTIPYVPYIGTGENFTITPRFGQHKFKPGSATVFLGEGASILNGQDFIDVSSFKLTGTVFYENTYCGVEGAIITVDGNPVIKDGNVIMTNPQGEFKISMPVGYHYVSVLKSGHDFKSYKFPPGDVNSKYNFQEDIVGINFIDTTRVKVVGRVVGGTIEGAKKPGLGLSTNNIGIAEFTYVPTNGCNCNIDGVNGFHLKTDSLTGEYSVELPPMKYLVKNMDVASNTLISLYFKELEVADFSVIMTPKEVSDTISGDVDAKFTIHTDIEKAYIYINEIDKTDTTSNVTINETTKIARVIYLNEVYEIAIDITENVNIATRKVRVNTKVSSTSYNHRLDFVYRSNPEIRVTAVDGKSEFTGAKSCKYEDPISGKLKEIDLEINKFNYPIFIQYKDYGLSVFAEEVYYNNDACGGNNGCENAVMDRVPINDGEIIVNNKLAIEENPDSLFFRNGRVNYTFKASNPNVSANGNFSWRSYSSVFNITAMIDDVGYEWKPKSTKSDLDFVYPLDALHPDDKYFRGYVLGSKAIKGGDFITNGPNVVDMIVRDPPGNGSYSYIEKGTTFSYEQSLTSANELGESISASIFLGPKFSTGLGFSSETEAKNELSLGFESKQKWEQSNTITNEITVTESWQTSDEPYLPGTPSDLMYGSSKNFIVSLSDNLTILPVSFTDGFSGDNDELKVAGKEVNGFKITLNKSLKAAPKGSDTHFIYTVDHIQVYLIPDLKKLINNLFVNNSKYTSKLAMSDEMYGSNNDDIRWGDATNNPVVTDKVDYTGKSYTFAVEFVEGGIPKENDLVRQYNQQIRLWEDALERNEMEKLHAELVKNISFDAGPYFEHSTATSISESHTSTFEASFDASAALTIGGKVGGIGLAATAGLSFNYTVGKTTTQSSTSTNTFGYVLHDEDEGDYFSVDVKDPGTGTGPVFILQGGRTMCPHETATPIDYYTVSEYDITDANIADFRSVGINEDLIKILSIDETSTVNYTTVKKYIPENEGVDELFDGVFDDIFKIKQIKGRKFKNKLDLVTTVESMINLNLDLSQGDNGSMEDIGDNLDDMDNDGMQDMAGQIDPGENGSAFSRIYLISKDKRDKLFKEWARFRSYIYNEAKIDSKNKQITSIGISTLRREVPTLDISPAIITNVPDDNKAYLTLIMGNKSYTKESQYYVAKVLESTNPDGAIIEVDGLSLNREYLIPYGEEINKTLSVKMGREDVYEYDDLKIIFYSDCERELVGRITSDMAEEAIDTVTFSVHFVPSCSDIDIVRPDDMFVINKQDEKLVDGEMKTKVPIVLGGYDLNNNILDKIAFQYKTLANPDWINTKPHFVALEEDEEGNLIPGAFTDLQWDLSGFPDGEYQMRAKTYCGNSPEGEQIFDLSEVWTGMVDRKAPQVFGSPQPADGILSPDDDIVIEFNETIYGQKLTKLENFDIRGILNGTEIRHDVSLRFNNDPKYFTRIPEGINLTSKSFTIEFWLKPARAYYNECILSQSTNSTDAVYIGLNTNGKFEINIGNKTLEFDDVSVSDVVEKWKHYAFSYDKIRNEVIMFMDGVPVGNKTLDVNYKGYGDVYIGKSLLSSVNQFEGNIHELRIWSRPRTASKIVSNMLISLSGKETGLIGYWPLNDADGVLAVDKVHKRNALVNAKWDISPSGYSCNLDDYQRGMINMEFGDVAFTREQDFTIELWFRGKKGSNQCLISNGYGDNNDVTIYYISPESLAKIVNVLPLEEDVDIKLAPMLNVLFGEETEFLNKVGTYLGAEKVEHYKDRILRYAKVPPTYWSINTDGSGYLQINNNGKRVKIFKNYFDNKWHHLALVVERIGNTRVFIDGELEISEPSTEWSGFGGARLFVGARGLFNVDLADFQFDQYFDGTIDELRIWSTALKQTQVGRNNKMRLDGNELGLVSYFPFESYKEVMGIALIDGLLADVLSPHREILTNMGVFTQNTDVPNVRMKRPSSKVDFDFVYKEDRIAFVINEPLAKIENCILDITVKDVQDMYGNRMSSPVTWNAYVDINQVKWDIDNISIDKKLYESHSFTSTIINSSGKQQNFSIENVPSWLKVSPRSGTLEPLTSMYIEFTVTPGVNVGEYSSDIHLQTDFDFDEKMMVDLRVFTDLPDDWAVESLDYEYSMNVVGMIKIKDVISTDKYDKIGIFVDGVCHGISSLTYVEDYDMYQVYLDIYSNEMSNEFFEIHIWDSSTGLEYRKVSADGLIAGTETENTLGLYEFVKNTVYGSPSQPIVFEASSNVIQKISLHKGWNWKSFNLEMDKSKPLTLQLEGMTPVEGDLIKGMTTYSEYGEYWLGTLNYLKVDEMYMMKVHHKDTLKVSGIPVDPSISEIKILKGWNWIGYTPQVNIEINEAFGTLNTNHGDVVKSQFAFSMYDRIMGWVGTLNYLIPNIGYKYLRVANGDETLPESFYYPKEGAVMSSAKKQKSLQKLKAQQLLSESIPNWSSYKMNMSIIAQINGVDNQSNADVIYAYTENVLVGKATPLQISGIEQLYFITVYGNEINKQISFKYQNNKGEEYSVNEQLAFNSSKIIGSTTSTFSFTINNEDMGVKDKLVLNNVNKVYPSPFKNKFNVDLNLVENSNVKIRVVNLTGFIVEEISANNKIDNYNIEIDLSEYPSGFYIVEVLVNEKINYFKIIKE